MRTGRLGGLIASPVLAALFLIPALNLGGIPPFSGFIGKVALLEAGAQNGSVLAWFLVAGSVVTSLLTLYAISRVWGRVFWRSPRAAVPDDDGGDDDVLVVTGDDAAQVVAERRLALGTVLPTTLLVAVSVAIEVNQVAQKVLDHPAKFGHKGKNIPLSIYLHHTHTHIHTTLPCRYYLVWINVSESWHRSSILTPPLSLPFFLRLTTN